MEVRDNQKITSTFYRMKHTLLLSGCRIHKCLLIVIIISSVFILYAIYGEQQHVWSFSHNIDHTSYTISKRITVHYILDRSNFRIGLPHFISIFSVVRFLKPKTIIFHAITWPWEESYWWRVIRQVAPQVIVRKVSNDAFSSYWSASNKTHQEMLLKLLILKEQGGIFFSVANVILKPLNYSEQVDRILSKTNSISSSFLHLVNTESKPLLQWHVGLNVMTDIESALCPLFMSYPRNASKKYSFVVNPVNVGWAELSQRECNRLRGQLDGSLWDNTQLAHRGRQVIYDYHGTASDFTTVPRIVHLFWNETTRRDLTFVEYMSIKSAYRIYKPKKIYFYIVHSSMKPTGFYWHDTLQLEQFEMVMLTNKDNLANSIEDLKVSVLERSGGIFLNLTCIVVNDVEFLRGYNGTVSFDGKHYGKQFIMLKHTYKYSYLLKIWKQHSLVATLNSPVLVTGDTTCLENQVCLVQSRSIDSETLDTVSDISDLFYVEVDNCDFNLHNATSIQTLNSTFGQAARLSLNGLTDIVDPKQFVIPNIIHYIWFGKNIQFQLFHLLGIYSAYIMQNPEKIYFHYNIIPDGPWWERMLRVVPIIEAVKTVSPDSIFGQPIKRYVEHKADIARMEILMKYGGIYLDTDVYVLRSPDPLRNRPYRVAQPVQNVLANGIIFSSKNSEFLRMFYESYRGDYRDDQWTYNSVIGQYKLSVNNRPEKVTIGPSDLMLKPNWQMCPRLWDNGTYIYWKDHYFMHLYCKRNHLDDLQRWDSEMYKHPYNTSLVGLISQFLFEKFQTDYIRTNTLTDTIMI